jgi:hypothetical protein
MIEAIYGAAGSALDNAGGQARLFRARTSAMPLKGTATMKQNLVRQWLVASVLLGLQGSMAPAQESQKAIPSPSDPTPPPAASSAAVKPAPVNPEPSAASETEATNSARNKVGIDEMLKMFQAGVSKDVIRTYIETAQVAAPLSATDIITLKERGLPDELTTAWMKRSAELNARASEVAATNAAPAKVSGTVSLEALAAAIRRGQFNSGRLDPESYDYFQYYYLTPRSIASANERIYSSPPYVPYSPYGPGYYSPWGLGPGFRGPPYRGPW